MTLAPMTVGLALVAVLVVGVVVLDWWAWRRVRRLRSEQAAARAMESKGVALGRAVLADLEAQGYSVVDTGMGLMAARRADEPARAMNNAGPYTDPSWPHPPAAPTAQERADYRRARNAAGMRRLRAKRKGEG